ncbi:MAG: acyl-CoA reductase [Saprospiraceae bacterium]
MTLDERIALLEILGDRLRDFSNPMVDMAITKAYHENQWFVPENTKKALTAIGDEFLGKEKLQQWLSQYDLSKIVSKKVGLVLAGNIPLVGFHDLLCTFISGHHAVIKSSSKDQALVNLVLHLMIDIKAEVADNITTTERLTDFDAVIATGSNNTAQHFDYYFRKYPKIIRKNRVSVAVLNGDESKDTLQKLGDDVFSYYGLGCRNVSKIFIPKGYKLDQLFEAFNKYQDIIHHNKYNNNYSYNEAIWLMGQDNFLTNGFIILKEEKSLYSRISSLYYEYYQDTKSLLKLLEIEKGNIQCVSTEMKLSGIDAIGIGQGQCPTLSDYADNVDTMDFLRML